MLFLFVVWIVNVTDNIDPLHLHITGTYKYLMKTFIRFLRADRRLYCNGNVEGFLL